MSNVSQGFIKTGIFPLNSKLFSDDDFLISYMTDKPDPVPLDDATPENLIPPTSEFSNFHNDVYLCTDTSRKGSLRTAKIISGALSEGAAIDAENWKLFGVNRIFYQIDELGTAFKKEKGAEVTRDLADTDIDSNARTRNPGKYVGES
ncbi:hypothetical protein JTB14_015177 [Gonioctena quinquepunctata]|nr:hypothetical protein JTB14_015177 [Gonioctena quinquepunctata]